MLDGEDTKRLLWHYGNLYDSTDLLCAFCAQRGMSLAEGFLYVVERKAELEKQLKYIEAQEVVK